MNKLISASARMLKECVRIGRLYNFRKCM